MHSSERIKLSEEDNTLITSEEEVVMKLNNFLSHAVFNLKIPKFENFDTEKTDHPTLKAIVKYRK